MVSLQKLRRIHQGMTGRHHRIDVRVTQRHDRSHDFIFRDSQDPLQGMGIPDSHDQSAKPQIRCLQTEIFAGQPKIEPAPAIAAFIGGCSVIATS